MPQLSPGNAPASGAEPKPENATAPAGSPQRASGAEVEADDRKKKQPKADFQGPATEKPSGAQAEPAEFAKDGGSVPPNMVPSGGGLVPLGSLPPEEQERRLDLRRTSGRLPDEEEFDEERLAAMSAPEVRAIGTSRGYKMPDMGGRKTMQRAFLHAQEEDEAFA